MQRSDLSKIILAGLALVIVLYFLLRLNMPALASFLALSGITALGAKAAKYSLQLEIFDSILYLGIILIALSMVNNVIMMLNLGYTLPSSWVTLMKAAEGLTPAIIIFAALSYAQAPARPTLYAWVALLGTIALTMQQGVMNTYMGLAIGIAIVSIALGLVLKFGVPYASIANIFKYVVLFVGIAMGINMIHMAGYLTWLNLPSWWPVLSSSILLGAVTFLFIAYVIARVTPTVLLAAASIYALFTYGMQGLQMLIYLALFSIAIWVVLGLLSASR
jgi:hypothetical protein